MPANRPSGRPLRLGAEASASSLHLPREAPGVCTAGHAGSLDSSREAERAARTAGRTGRQRARSRLLRQDSRRPLPGSLSGGRARPSALGHNLAQAVLVSVSPGFAQ